MMVHCVEYNLELYEFVNKVNDKFILQTDDYKTAESTIDVGEDNSISLSFRTDKVSILLSLKNREVEKVVINNAVYYPVEQEVYWVLDGMRRIARKYKAEGKKRNLYVVISKEQRYMHGDLFYEVAITYDAKKDTFANPLAIFIFTVSK